MSRAFAFTMGWVFLGGVVWLSADALSSEWSIVTTFYDLISPAKPKPVVVAPVQSQVLSPFAAKFHNHLMSLVGGQSQAFDSAQLTGVKYFAFYYSASWCPPCRAFTPDLVAFYNDFKPAHPDFELIFVNDDHSEQDMVSYMQNDSMPWPAISFSDIDSPDLNARKYCGSGIPCLVLVDSDGSVLSDTFQDGQYTDPHHVIDDIRSMVK